MASQDDLVRRGTPDYRRALGALFSIGVGAYAMTYAPQPLLRIIGEQYGVSASQSALLVSATTFGLAAFVLIWGAVSARVSERRIIIGGLAGAVVASLIIPFAPTWNLVVGLRALQGMALAGPITTALAWVGRHVEFASVARVSGLYIAGTTVGGMTGRLLSGIVNELTGDWRIALATVSILAAVLGGVAHLFLPVTKGREKSGPPPPLRPDSRWCKRQRLVAYVFGFVGMGLFIGIFNVLGYRVAEPPLNLGTSVTSLLFLSYLAGTYTSARSGNLAQRIGTRTVMMVGSLTMAVGVAFLIPASQVTLWIGLFVFCAGFFVMHSQQSGRASSLHPKPGIGSGLYLTYYYIGSSVGGIIFGFAWDKGGWPATLALAFGSIAVIVVLAVLTSNEETENGHVKIDATS